MPATYTFTQADRNIGYTPPTPCCDVCGAPADYHGAVRTSGLGAFSLRYCETCAENDAEPFVMLCALCEDDDGLDEWPAWMQLCRTWVNGQYWLFAERLAWEAEHEK